MTHNQNGGALVTLYIEAQLDNNLNLKIIEHLFIDLARMNYAYTDVFSLNKRNI